MGGARVHTHQGARGASTKANPPNPQQPRGPLPSRTHAYTHALQLHGSPRAKREPKRQLPGRGAVGTTAAAAAAVERAAICWFARHSRS